jgi:hypothetical protein
MGRARVSEQRISLLSILVCCLLGMAVGACSTERVSSPVVGRTTTTPTTLTSGPTRIDYAGISLVVPGSWRVLSADDLPQSGEIQDTVI